MNTVTIIGPTRRASYDAYLRRASVGLNTQPSTLVNYSYDEASRLKDVVNGIHSATYAYLENSPLIGQIEFKQSGTKLMTTSKQYDKVNRLTSIASSNSQGNSLASFAYDYNEANQRTQTRLMNGSYWVYNYDALGQVVSGKKYWADGSPVAGQQFEYAFDEIGNRTGTKAGGDQNGANLRPASYSPNLLNQYSSRTVPRAFDVTGVGFATNSVTVNGLMTYRKGEYFQKELGLGSIAAWWTNIQVQAGGSTTSGYVFTPATPEMFQYDQDGNLTNDGRWSYWWDGENRLTNMVANTTKGPQLNIRFEYDWQGRRIAKKVWSNIAGSGSPVLDEKYVYDGWNLIAILNPDLSPRTSFMWGSDLSGSMQGAGGVGGLLAVYDRANGVHFTAFDGNGNVAALVSAATGEPSAQYEYGPFGEVLRATGPMAKANPFRFSTKYQDDETDLFYYGYRYYNASMGRWLSRDLIKERGFRVQALMNLNTEMRFVLKFDEDANLYGFASGGPVDQTDLLGLATSKPSTPKPPRPPKPPKPPGNPCGNDETKCKCCMVFAEGRGTEDACQKAVASVIENRMAEQNKTACQIISAGNGKQFNGYTTPSYKNCCNDKCKNNPKGAQSETERQQAFSNCSPDFDASYGANYFASGSTPGWIQERINDGTAEELKVPGSTKMRFYYVEPQ